MLKDSNIAAEGKKFTECDVAEDELHFLDNYVKSADGQRWWTMYREFVTKHILTSCQQLRWPNCYKQMHVSKLFSFLSLFSSQIYKINPHTNIKQNIHTQTVKELVT